MATETPTQLKFATLDVFTSQPYTGNPLSIVQIPTSLRNTITQEQKQRIAKEFNLSETVFLHESTNTSEHQIDIFTTDAELPFAGHPTIGSAAWVLYLSNRNPEKRVEGGKGTLITKAGPIPITLSNAGDGNGFEAQADVPHKTHLHTPSPPLSSITDFSGLSAIPEIRERELTGSLFSIVKGMTFLLVQLDSVEMLAKVSLGGPAIDFSPFLDEDWKPSFVARYYYVVLPSSSSSSGNKDANKNEEDEEVVRLRTRMVESNFEDPATGSAACALSAYLAGKRGKNTSFEIVQGVEMGRRSVIGTRVLVDDAGEVKGVRLEGSACLVMEGVVRV